MKLIKQGEQEGRRCAVVGLYTDRMAMSVMQRGEQGSFCLYRRQWEGELLDQQGELDVERLAGVADSFRRLAHKLCCEEVHFCGYGLLRYRQGLREELEQKLGCPVQMVSGLQQARAASLGLFGGQSVGRGAAGIYSGDLSTQFFGAVGWRQSVPLGWRALWKQGEGLIPNRVQEEQLRRTARELLARGGVHSDLPTPRIDAGGFDGVARLALLLCGADQDTTVCLESENIRQLLFLLHNPSLNWLGPLQKAQPQLPQKIFCQLIILQEAMRALGAGQAALRQVWLEDWLEKDDCREKRGIPAGLAGADL